MSSPELIILAGSAGSYQPIFTIVKTLPKDFPIPVLIVMHRGKGLNHNITEVLNANSVISIKEVSDKEAIEKGNIYLVPADYHVLIEQNRTFAIDNSEPVLFSRPSIDVTLNSAIEVYKNRLMAILFSGANKDGAAGLLKLKNQGGFSYVQHLEDAEVKTMPMAALSLANDIKQLHNEEIIKLLQSFIKNV